MRCREFIEGHSYKNLQGDNEDNDTEYFYYRSKIEYGNVFL